MGPTPRWTRVRWTRLLLVLSLFGCAVLALENAHLRGASVGPIANRATPAPAAPRRAFDRTNCGKMVSCWRIQDLTSAERPPPPPADVGEVIYAEDEQEVAWISRADRGTLVVGQRFSVHQYVQGGVRLEKGTLQVLAVDDAGMALCRLERRARCVACDGRVAAPVRRGDVVSEVK